MWNAYRTRLSARLLRPIAICNYLDRKVFSASTNEATSVGFKLMYDQLKRLPEVIGYLRWRKLALVHLMRDNLLDILISRARMRATRTAHEFKAGDRVKVKLDTVDLVRNLDRMSRDRAFARGLCRRLGVPFREGVYEDLVADGPGAYADLVTFLGETPEQQMTSNLRKIILDPQWVAVENFEEVRKILAPTPHARFLRLAADS